MNSNISRRQFRMKVRGVDNSPKDALKSLDTVGGYDDHPTSVYRRYNKTPFPTSSRPPLDPA